MCVCASPAEIVWLRSSRCPFEGGVAEVLCVNKSDGLLDEVWEKDGVADAGSVFPTAVPYDAKGSSIPPAEWEEAVLPAQGSWRGYGVVLTLLLEDNHEVEGGCNEFQRPFVVEAVRPWRVPTS